MEMDASPIVSVAKTSVWWDIENCRPPSDVNPYDIARNISNCLHAFNLVGPLTISAYGDTYQLTRHVQNALTSTGIILNHIPSGRKEASDKAILMNMGFWSGDNPPPANVLLITGDQDFSAMLHRLQMRRFNVLLARPEGVHVSESLLNSANTVWYWSRLARAEIGHLNFPREARSTRASAEPVYVQKSQQRPSNNHNIVFRPEIPGPIARPPQGVSPFRNPLPPPIPLPPNERHPPPVLQHPHYNPPQLALRRQQQQQQFARPPPPPPQEAQFHEAASGMSFLQWSSLPQCFSGVSEACVGGGGGGRPQFSAHFPIDQDYYRGRDVINRALMTLRVEMMLPTESNIYNNIVYGQKLALNFKLRPALEQGAKLGELVMKNAGVGGAEQIFLPVQLELWSYVDPNLCQEYDADIWNDFRNFLCGEEVHAFINSANQYHAALVLRGHGIGRLSDLALAQIYNVIQLAILVRLWIKPHRNWSPLAITITRSSLGAPACTAVLEEKAVDVVHQSAVSTDIADHFERTAFDVVNKVLEEPTLDLVNERHHAVEVLEEEEPAVYVPTTVPLQVELKQASAKVLDKATVKAVEKIRKDQPVSVIKELKAWLPSMLSEDGYDISLVRQDFQAARGITLDHQALGYPKLLDIMRKISDVVQISSPRPGLCKLYPPGTVVTQSKARDKFTTAEILLKLRAWLPSFIGKRGVCDLASVCKEFEKECKMKLQASALGFPSATTLFEQFTDIVKLESLQSGDVVLTSAKKLPSQKAAIETEDLMTEGCKTLLLESIPRCKSGYPVARLKEDFQQRYGYVLDHAGCGFKKLETFLERMNDRVGIKTGSGGHKLLYLKDVNSSELMNIQKLRPEESIFINDRVIESDTKPAPKSAAAAKNSKKQKQSEAVQPSNNNKQPPQANTRGIPVYLRYGYVEVVAESRLTVKPSNPLCMVD